MILPYVYKLANKSTGEFYYGYRSKNVKLNLRPEDDLGVRYFTSSKYVRPRFHEFSIDIIALFFTINDAYEFEQDLIMKTINDNKSLNRHYQKNGNKKFKHDTPHTIKSKEKMMGPRGKINRVATGHTPWNKGKSKDTDIRLAKLAQSRAKAGNLHQLGMKYSDERIKKIKDKLTGRKMTPLQIGKMSKAKKGKTWIEIYGEEGAALRKKSAANKKGKTTALTKVVHTPDGVFDTMTMACEHYQISDFTLRRRCRSDKEKFKDWYYVASPIFTIVG